MLSQSTQTTSRPEANLIAAASAFQRVPSAGGRAPPGSPVVRHGGCGQWVGSSSWTADAMAKQ